jgi:hypothetical protein
MAKNGVLLESASESAMSWTDGQTSDGYAGIERLGGLTLDDRVGPSTEPTGEPSVFVNPTASFLGISRQ